MDNDHKKLRSILPKNKYITKTNLFSDEEEENDIIPSLKSYNATFSSSQYIDPVYISSYYHIHQAEMALFHLKNLLNERLDDGWKKALKHKKSGVCVYMKSSSSSSSSTTSKLSSSYSQYISNNHFQHFYSSSNHQQNNNNPYSTINSSSSASCLLNDKIPIFKGEAIFKGFTPHSIFYVIGMRKLWDDQYEDGNLVENLNDTTSLTYEVWKSNNSSKQKDLCLVEKIECTHDGTILFAASSVETPKVPRVQGRSRSQIKLMGWALEPISNPVSSTPITRVTYIIQEPVKGWMSGLNKKSIARRPLIIALVHDYLKSKAERTIDHLYLHPNPSSSTKRPSILQHSVSTCINQHHQNTHSTPIPQKNHSSPQLLSTTKKQITFKNDTNNNKEVLLSIPKTITTTTLNSTSTLDTSSSSFNTTHSQPIYPFHRHLSTRNECIDLLKQLYNTLDGWQLEYEEENIKSYVKNHHGIFYSRIDAKIHHDWHPEQICSFLHNMNTRKHWDKWWKQGTIKERFSQKDYLVHWIIGDDHLSQDISAITYIDSDNIQKKIFMASKSVDDDMIPENKEQYQRTHIDLYGWVFSTKSSSSSTSTSSMTQLTFITDSSSLWAQKKNQKPFYISSIHQIDHYLSNYGCPPYIRRVAGKVIQEQFNPTTFQYQLTWIAKHQPPNVYKKQIKSTTWCTDIRIDIKKMYPSSSLPSSTSSSSFYIDISPKIGTKIDIDSNGKIIKIFTTDHFMEGKTISITLSKKSHHDSPTQHFYQLQQQKQFLNQQNKLLLDKKNLKDHQELNKNDDHFILNNEKEKQFINDSCTIPPTINVEKKDDHEHSISLTETKSSIHFKSIQPTSSSSSSSPSSTTTSSSQLSKLMNHDHHVITTSKISDTNIIQIPKDYILIPPQEYHHHQQHTIIHITNELTFNGQQLILILFSMMISYYMGKLASTC